MFSLCRAEEYYSNALFLNPNGREVYEPVLHAVRCHKKLEMALESEHKHLLKVVEDLREYKKQHETLSSLIAKLVAEQATPDARLNARMSYEQLKIMSSKDGKGQVSNPDLGGLSSPFNNLVASFSTALRLKTWA